MRETELTNFRRTNEAPGEYIDIYPDGEAKDRADKKTQNAVDAEIGMYSAEHDLQEGNACTRCIYKVQTRLGTCYRKNKSIFFRVFLTLCAIGYAVYFGFAMNYRFGDEGSIRLLWVTCVVLFFVCIYIIKTLCGASISTCMRPCMEKISHHSIKISWMTVGLLFLFIVIFTVVDVIRRGMSYNLVSVSGILAYILLFFIFSHNPAKVRWRPVVWGLGLQFIFALLILRTWWGREAFKWLGDRVSEFLNHALAGSLFTFGNPYATAIIAIQILAYVVFFGMVISTLYYLGVMQWVFLKMSAIMEVTMGTTAAESIPCAGNIFLGLTESPMLVRPYLSKLTKSELHAIMTGGFATLAGGIMGFYIAMGVPADHLLSASVMSAPAALAMSKLIYPETEISERELNDHVTPEKSTDRNLIDAASSGATSSVKIFGYLLANVMAFVAALSFINATLTWFGARVGLEPPNYPNLTFELICSYLLYPFAMAMGVALPDCRKVAQMIGVKIFLSDFIAYQQLSVYISNRNIYEKYNGTTITRGDDLFLVSSNTTLVGGVMEARSEVISTYALCGYASLSAMGVQLGGLGAMAPQRKGDLSKLVLRALITGHVACFMTGCISGLFFTA